MYLEEHPPKPLSDDVKLRLSQKIDKSRNASEEQVATSKYGGSIKKIDTEDDNKDNPIVSLEPEVDNKMMSKKNSTMNRTFGNDQDQ